MKCFIAASSVGWSTSLSGDRNLPFMQKASEEHGTRASCVCSCKYASATGLPTGCGKGIRVFKLLINQWFLETLSSSLQLNFPVSEPTLRPWPCLAIPYGGAPGSASLSSTIHFVSTPAEPEVVTARNRQPTGRQASEEQRACLV